jgi:putative tryptophan/tyrosine transport system substrate-binding protein
MPHDSCEPLRKAAEPGREELARLGHVEGRNLTFEWHCFGSDFTRGARIAADLVSREMDVLYTNGRSATKLLQSATKRIPIVTHVADPVGDGFTKSLARPDSNITGFCGLHPETPAKQVELIRRIMPKLERLWIVGSARNPGELETLRPYETASRAAGLSSGTKLLAPSELESFFGGMKGSRTQAAFIDYSRRYDEAAEIPKLALKYRVMAIYYNQWYVERGGLVSFEMYHANSGHREVAIFDKLLRGIVPADISWELPDRSHLAVNLRTARSLALTLPSDVLLGAEQVIE